MAKNHTGEKLFWCNKCIKTFWQDITLEIMAKKYTGENHFGVASANGLFDNISLWKSWQKITQEKNHFDVTSANRLFVIISLWKSWQKITREKNHCDATSLCWFFNIRSWQKITHHHFWHHITLEIMAKTEEVRKHNVPIGCQWTRPRTVICWQTQALTWEALTGVNGVLADPLQNPDAEFFVSWNVAPTPPTPGTKRCKPGASWGP